MKSLIINNSVRKFVDFYIQSLSNLFSSSDIISGLCVFWTMQRLYTVHQCVFLQTSTSVRQTTEVVILTLCALTLRAAFRAPVQMATKETALPAQVITVLGTDGRIVYA